MKWIIPLTVALLVSQSHAQENANPFDVRVSVTPVEDRFRFKQAIRYPLTFVVLMPSSQTTRRQKISQEFWRLRSFLERVTKFGLIELLKSRFSFSLLR